MFSHASGTAVADQPTQELEADWKQIVSDLGRATATPRLLLGAPVVYRPRHQNPHRKFPRIYSYFGKHRA